VRPPDDGVARFASLPLAAKSYRDSMRPLLQIGAQNFRSLRKVSVELQSLNVLVGPNEAGKSNFLDLIQFLGDSARDDLGAALEKRGGIDRVRFRGSDGPSGRVAIDVAANVTSYSSQNAPDEYGLTFSSRTMSSGRSFLVRGEEFKFKRFRGGGRRITVRGNKADLINYRGEDVQKSERLPLRSDSLALSTLRRLPSGEGGREVDRFAQLFTTFRVFNVDVERARRPGRISNAALRPDGSNLASALISISRDEDRFADLLDDAREMVPGFEGIEFEEVGGSSPALAVKLIERGLKDSTWLEDASFGTVRILALLAVLYDPHPPLLTCLEEVDQGLHPYVFDRLVERLREASLRTQLLLTTHSPALVNRLAPQELLVCERAADGSTRLPAIDTASIKNKEAAVGGRMQLGELWFSGSLGGVPR